MSLRSSISTPDGKRRYVRRLFATIADRYDWITVILSYGQDRRWKRRLAAMAQMPPRGLALDLAAGTGDIAFEVARRGARVVGLDITPRMVALARQRQRQTMTGAGAWPSFLVGDMMSLPFRAGAFDLVTSGYGIRNVPIVEQALVEIARVLKPGGQLLSLDFDRPSNRLVRRIYLGYLTVVGSLLGLVFHGDPDTYRYIPESIRFYPGAEAIAARMREIGFPDARRVPVLGGLMAINVGRKAVSHGCGMELDTSNWSGEGTFTRALIDAITGIDAVAFLQAEDAPASRADSGFTFISNEIYVRFQSRPVIEKTRWLGFVPTLRRRLEAAMTLPVLEAALARVEGIGPPDYSDHGMIQYLRTERIVPAYQTRGFKIIEMVRIYEVGQSPRDRPRV